MAVLFVKKSPKGEEKSIDPKTEIQEDLVEDANGDAPVESRGGIENRKDPRGEHLVLKVKDTSAAGKFFGFASNLSRSGMFIATVKPRELGEEFEITFNLPDSGEPITCRCYGVWVRRYSPDSGIIPGMGIRFMNMNDETKIRIDAWIKAKDE